MENFKNIVKTIRRGRKQVVFYEDWNDQFSPINDSFYSHISLHLKENSVFFPKECNQVSEEEIEKLLNQHGEEYIFPLYIQEDSELKITLEENELSELVGVIIIDKNKLSKPNNTKVFSKRFYYNCYIENYVIGYVENWNHYFRSLDYYYTEEILNSNDNWKVVKYSYSFSNLEDAIKSAEQFLNEG